jgi:plastocyanin
MLRRRTTPLAWALAGLLLGVSGCTLPTTDNGGGYGPSGPSRQSGRADQALVGGATATRPDKPLTVLESGVPAVLKVSESSWAPASYVVAPGASIALKVVNDDATQHNFTLEAPELSRNLPGGEELLLKFSAPGPGRHRFYCKYHRQEMQGWITVK